MKPALKKPVRSDLQEVWDTYRPELEKVEALIHKNLNSDSSLVNEIALYILSSGGKRIRPLLVIMTARLCRYAGEQHLFLAMLVEFIHTATLLHDDVIDQGDIRRGKKSVRALWGNHASILVGDYLYVSAAANSLELNDGEINRALLGACSRMIEGEMTQYVHHSDLNVTVEEYLSIVRNKTASLMSAACRLGAVVAKVSEVKKEILTQFGMDLGIAFQVSDDTLDYAANKTVFGKALGSDLKEGKITLPLLHLLRSCTEEESLKIKRIVKGADVPERDFGYIKSLMLRYGSIQYALDIARQYVDTAKSRLDHFDDSLHKKALLALSDYVVARDH
jgi:octaprenyl-diphosphate synthase